MKKYLLTISLLIFCAGVSAQTHDPAPTKSEFNSEISKLNVEIKALEKKSADLKQTNSNQQKQINVIEKKLSGAQAEIQKVRDSLSMAFENVSSAKKQTQSQIKVLDQTITTRTLYWIIAILAVMLLSVIIFFVLRSKLSTSAKSLGSQITRTNEILQNEAIKLDSKLVEILQTQLSILREERKTNTTNTADHKLPLKVGEEIHRMRKRIESLPQDVKGIGSLTNSLQRLEEEFNENGYEMEDLLGKKYVDGMKMEARFVDNPDVPKGEEIITDVLRPEIKYKGVVIQVAKVEVGKS